VLPLPVLFCSSGAVRVKHDCLFFAQAVDMGIEQAVRPSGSRRAALDDLKDASAKATETLQSACPKGISTTPLARLDVLQKRVYAMAKSVKMVRPAMKHFHALPARPRRRFDMIGSRERPATTVGEKP
jgi:hypothetical protein